MIVRVEKRDDPYVRIDKRAIEDSRLSWKARGLLCYLLSKPNDWVVRFQHLVSQGPDGRIACRSALAELEALGYAKRVRRTDERGKVTGWEYVIYEIPQPVGEDREPETPDAANLQVDNRACPSPQSENLQLGTPDACFPEVENRPLLTNEVVLTNEVSQLQGDAVASAPPELPDEPPPRSPRKPRYMSRPVETWNVADLIAYLLDESNRLDKTLAVPKKGMAGHLKALLRQAEARYDGKAAVAVKALIDACLPRPEMRGTGYLLYEAERFWSRFVIPQGDITEETW